MYLVLIIYFLKLLFNDYHVLTCIIIAGRCPNVLQAEEMVENNHKIKFTDCRLNVIE